MSWRIKSCHDLVIEDDEVSVADVEAGEVVAGVLGVEDVLVDDERRPARLGRVAHSDLSENELHFTSPSPVV